MLQKVGEIANQVMARLAFGECYSTEPDTPTVAAKWGARLIIEETKLKQMQRDLQNGGKIKKTTHALPDQKLDIVYDRQDNKGEEADRLALHEWLDDVGMPWLKAQIPWRRDRQDERRLDTGRFHLKASTNASFGYLYVCAWMEDDHA